MARSGSAKKTSARRSPISRQEGERRLIAAATSLLQSRPFSSVSVRDLAAAADVHQSYIHTWFGSQNGLYIRVLHDISAQLVDHLSSSDPDVIPIDPNDPTARFAVRLLFWLDLEGCDLSAISPVLQSLATAHAQRLTNLVGVDPSTASQIAPQGLITFLGMSAFGHLVGTDPDQIHRVAMSRLRKTDSIAKDSAPDTM